MKQYILGIDLGTTNSVLAYSELSGESPEVRLLPIPQLVAPATLENRDSLPSFLYLPSETEQKGNDYRLPTTGKKGKPAPSPESVVGELARWRSAEVPDRTVSAAKSWLCHSKVDRREPILPWNAPEEVPKISPLLATQRYLEHLIAVWEKEFPEAPIAEQEVVLTVPASFDASARELTREAAIAAGLPAEMLFLEEPQAAIYAWLEEVGDSWRKTLTLEDTLLICDVGGGTTDLTLIGVEQEEGDLILKRIAVGEHLLIGGDNMDLALAHYAAGLLAERGTQLDPWQTVSLWHSARAAKEALLAVDEKGEKDGGKSGKSKKGSTYPISVLGRGTKLIGGTITVDLEKEKVAELLGDGFFPDCELSEKPRRRGMSGFKELGLPFEQETGITRHLGAFLSAHGAKPTHVLLNGGVFKAPLLHERLFEVLGHWFPDRPPQVLESASGLDHAVARGAAYYGWTKQRGGVRIRGGTARSYYIGIETAGLAIPGAPRPLKALCVAPFGMEEGTSCDVPSAEIGLVVGETAHFRFFSSTLRKQDKPGAVLDASHFGAAESDLQETDSMEAELPATAGEGEPEEDYIPVRFRTRITELGTMELWCDSAVADRHWKLEFSVREE